MPKVLHVITGLGVGGAELMLARLLERTDRERFPSVVVSLTDGLSSGATSMSGSPVHALGMPPGMPDPRGLLRLGRLVDDERPDVVQTWLYHADLAGLLAGRWKRVGAIAWNIRCAALTVEESSRSVVALRSLLARLSAMPTVVVANSEAGRQAHEAVGYRPRRWAIIPNGFDLDALRPDPAARAQTRARLDIPNASPVIGMVARLHPIKDHRTFFAASRQLADTTPEAVFVLAGLGLDAENPTVRGWFSEFGLDPSRYRLLGVGERVDALLPACDVCTLTSTSEGFPNVIGEAMSAGVPCIATDAGDSARIIGDTGHVVPVRSPEALAAAWQSFFAMPLDARRGMGIAARARIERDYSLDRAVSQYVDLYESLATGRASA